VVEADMADTKVIKMVAALTPREQESVFLRAAKEFISEHPSLLARLAE